ncbi:MAG: LCP family protein [Candidatus Nanopelagicaceae bacterium]
MKSPKAIKYLTWTSIGIVLVSAFAWVGLSRISGAISRVSVFDNLINRPERASSALNYLVVGSDTREGLTKEELRLLRVGSTKTADGARSDTMMLVHISKSRDNAVVISIPRDSLVTVPEHIGLDGKTKVPATQAKINAAFAWGGAPLLIQTIEAKTNLRIDHYVEVNFAGFKNVVDALGGIQVCSKVPINDPQSHLVMDAGVHTLNGIEALKYVRTRDFDGLGDIGRMQRQQQFVSSVFRKATSTGVLLNPFKVKDLISAVFKTVKTDETLNQGDIVNLAKQIKNLSPSKMRTMTIPLGTANGYVAGLGSVVIWHETLAPELFDRLRNDQPVVDQASPSPSAKKKATASPSVIDKFKTSTASENLCGQVKY